MYFIDMFTSAMLGRSTEKEKIFKGSHILRKSQGIYKNNINLIKMQLNFNIHVKKSKYFKIWVNSWQTFFTVVELVLS